MMEILAKANDGASAPAAARPRAGEIIIERGALDDCDARGGTIVLRGVINTESFHLLKADEYQRKGEDRADIFGAYISGQQVPDIELGMRGQRFRSQGDTFWLQDDVYIIDGVQRIHNAKRALALAPETPIRIGAMIHFNTDKTWERHRFEIVNARRVKVSPNVRLRNYREDSNAILSLYGLCHSDKSFPLHGRVCWGQSMARNDLITATTLLMTCIDLHSHVTGRPGRSIEKTVRALNLLVEHIPLQTVRGNMSEFYRMINDAWGLESITYRQAAPQVKNTFLQALSRLCSDHHDFWKDAPGRVFFADSNMRAKLGGFRLDDPEVARLSGSSGTANEILYELLKKHINSGKRTANHLQVRKVDRFVTGYSARRSG